MAQFFCALGPILWKIRGLIAYSSLAYKMFMYEKTDPVGMPVGIAFMQLFVIGPDLKKFKVVNFHQNSYSH